MFNALPSHLPHPLQGVLKHRNKLQLERDNLREEREKKQKAMSDPKVQANPQKQEKMSQEFTKVMCVCACVSVCECILFVCRLESEEGIDGEFNYEYSLVTSIRSAQ